MQTAANAAMAEIECRDLISQAVKLEAVKAPGAARDQPRNDCARRKQGGSIRKPSSVEDEGLGFEI